MNQRPATSHSPAQPFFATPLQRLALARQRYFDEGVRPSGLVGDNVIQSWSRCVQAGREPGERIAFDPITPGRVQAALACSRLLLDAAAADLTQLEHTLAGTACTAILTDAHGVVVHATRSAADRGELLLPLASRVGVNLAEEQVGTGAPGVALRTGQLCTVLGGEHFFSHLKVLHCAAAPIRDAQGRIAAVLDVTSESRPFGFDAAAVVALYATTIENQLLQAQSTDHIVVHLQTAPALLGTPMEGLAGLDARGRIAWVNNVGARLLGMAQGDLGLRADAVFGLDASQLARLTREAAATLQRLPNGLSVWLAARMRSRDGATGLFQLRGGAAAETAAIAPVGTLRDNDRHLITQTLRECGGNVSKAARTLGVSRGLVYRHLRQKAPSPP